LRLRDEVLQKASVLAAITGAISLRCPQTNIEEGFGLFLACPWANPSILELKAAWEINAGENQ